MSPAFQALVLGKHEAAYDVCEKCGFLCARQPHWLEEAYSSAIATTDTGLVARNVAIAKKLAAVLYFLMAERGAGRYVDVAGGFGMLTRLMRDYGFDFYWHDKYCENVLAPGYDYASEMGACRAATAIEVLEHTEDPVSFIAQTLRYGHTDTLVFTTQLYEGNPPAPGHWWYYSFETGQHISFFQRRTLAALAAKTGLHLCSNGWIHVLSRKSMNEMLLRALTGRLNSLALRRLRKHLASRTRRDHDERVGHLNRTTT